MAATFAMATINLWLLICESKIQITYQETHELAGGCNVMLVWCSALPYKVAKKINK